MKDVDRQLLRKDVSEKEKMELLGMIVHDYTKCRTFMTGAIDNAIVAIVNICNYRVKKQGQERQCQNKREAILAIKELPLPERVALVHFVTSFARDVLYRDAVGCSHQEACEDAFLDTYNITFDEQSRFHLKAGFKTCVGSMHGECSNRIKQHLIRGCMPVGMSVSK